MIKNPIGYNMTFRRNFRQLLGPLLKTGLPLIGNVLKTSAKSVLIPSVLIVAASARDAGIHEKMFGLAMTTLTISYEEISDIME